MSLSSIGNVADLSNDGMVNYTDMKLFMNKLFISEVLLAEDLNRDVIINFVDFAVLAENWLWEE